MTMLVGTYGLVKILRRASSADLRTLGVGIHDQEDFKALRCGDLVVVAQEDGSERLYHRYYLEALNGKTAVSVVFGEGEAWLIRG